jgi:hypothetical protein
VAWPIGRPARPCQAFRLVYGDGLPTHLGLGNVREAQGDYEKAPFHHSKDQEVYVAVYCDGHPLVADTQANMGVVYEKGNVAKAKEVFSEAHMIQLEKLGPDHPRTQQLKPFYLHLPR